MPVHSDKNILEQFRDKKQREAAFRLLVNEYSERLYWHCRRLVISHEDADDALQNTLIKVWGNLENFRAESGLYTWLFRIATNESLSLIKSRKRHALNSGTDYEMELSDTLETDPWFDGDEAQRKLQQAILSLPEKQRIVFNLKYYEEMKYEEMAGILDTSVGALKASYHHAVKKIEKFVVDE
jgi:RNA polymerase sigma-70 factor (ECF subfamily)